MSRTKNVMSLWRCPACGLEQEALALEVAHACPKRLVQTDPGRGKRKLSLVVKFEKIHVPDQEQRGTLSEKLRQETKNIHRRVEYLRMTITPAGAK
jgi:heme oxygenase